MNREPGQPAGADSMFVSSVPFEPHRVHAAAIYCSDGRWGDQVDEFLHHHLKLPNYDRLAIPGGAGWLALRSSSLTQLWLLRDQLDLLVQVHQLTRVVLIAHQGCAYYAKKHVGTAEALLEAQREDLREAARTLGNWYPTLQTERYLARIEASRVAFVPV